MVLGLVCLYVCRLLGYNLGCLCGRLWSSCMSCVVMLGFLGMLVGV